MHTVTPHLEKREHDTGVQLDAGWMHRALCLTTLPARQQPVSASEREVGVSTFRRATSRCVVELHTNHPPIPELTRKVAVPNPHGTMARAIIFGMGAHAKKNGASPAVEITHVKDWMSANGAPSPNHMQMIAAKDHLMRLGVTMFIATLQANTRDNNDKTPLKTMQSPLIEELDTSVEDLLAYEAALAGDKSRWKDVRWPAGYVLNKKMFESFREDAVAVPMQCLRPLMRSSVAMDIFTHLCYQGPIIPKGDSVLLTWDEMRLTFGDGGYAGHRQRFREIYREAIKLALDAYPGAKVTHEDDGLRIHHSDPIEFAKTFVAVRLPEPITRKVAVHSRSRHATLQESFL